jgi:HlyD family secretion protein
MQNRKRLFVLLGALVIIGVYYFLFSFNKEGKSPLVKSYTTEPIERGNVTAMIKAFGTVESEKDILLLSPERCIVKDVHFTPGNKVKKNDLIMELDEESVEKEVERMNDQLEMKRNALKKIQLNAESTKIDLAHNEEVKKLRITSLKASLADQQRRLSDGSITQSQLDRTQQEINRAENDLQMLVEKNAVRIRQLETEEKGMQQQIDLQEQNLRDKKAMLGKLNIYAPVPGVILEVNGEQGARVEADRMLVKMADLSSFKIVGMIEAKYNYLVKTGNRVVVHLEGKDLDGQLGKIIPIFDNRLQFEVYLVQKSDPQLIPDQNLPLDIFSSEQENVLRMKKLPGFENSTRQLVYVVRGEEAVKTEVIFGTVGDEWCEVVSGLNAGDVILSNGPDPSTGPPRIALK